MVVSLLVRMFVRRDWGREYAEALRDLAEVLAEAIAVQPPRHRATRSRSSVLADVS
jgi:hypothetical protein